MGLRQGDIIQRINGQTPQNLMETLQLLEDTASSPRILFQRRNGIRLVSTDADSSVSSIVLDAEDHTGGYRVAEVAEGSAAARAGVRRGDRLVSIDGQTTENLQQLGDALRVRPPVQHTLVVRRGNATSQVKL
jgi:S1-C subfamily serine protease